MWTPNLALGNGLLHIIILIIFCAALFTGPPVYQSMRLTGCQSHQFASPCGAWVTRDHKEIF
eukprot:scaffold143616_cov18-Tisochrysis_lutea.AAC.1